MEGQNGIKALASCATVLLLIQLCCLKIKVSNTHRLVFQLHTPSAEPVHAGEYQHQFC